MHWLVACLLAFIGWTLGALVNYLADVLPVYGRLARPSCQACNAAYSWRNYWLWPRRCHTCQKLPRPRAWFVHICLAGAAIWLWFLPPPRLGFWFGMPLLVYFTLVVVIDLEHRLILHSTSIFGAGLAAIIGIYLHGWMATALGGAVGFLAMLLLFTLGEWMVRLINRVRQNKVDDVALGFGDVNLAGILGLLLGWPGVTLGLFVSILLGGLVSLLVMLGMLLTRRYQWFTALPYGPFLIAGAFFLIYFRKAAQLIFGQ